MFWLVWCAKVKMWFLGWKGASGFSASSTAEQVTQGIDGTALTAIVTGFSFSFPFLKTCFFGAVQIGVCVLYKKLFRLKQVNIFKGCVPENAIVYLEHFCGMKWKLTKLFSLILFFFIGKYYFLLVENSNPTSPPSFLPSPHDQHYIFLSYFIVYWWCITYGLLNGDMSFVELLNKSDPM